MNRRQLALLALAVAAAGCAPKATPMERGLSLYDQGYHLSAVMAFDEAVRESPQSSMAYMNRGVARIRTGDTKGALEDFTRASELSPRDAEIWFNRGNVYVAEGDFAAAIADFTRAVQLRPEFARAFFNRGIARLRGGDEEGARADWQRAVAVERDPKTREAMARAARLDSTDLRRAAPSTPRAGGKPPTPGASPLAQTPASPPPAAASPSASAGAPPPPAPASQLDSHALANRALDRELHGDHEGALADLKSALEVERDPQRRAGIEKLLRLLQSPR